MAYIRKLPSGNFQVQVRLKGLKPITRSFSNKTLAKEFAREIEGNSELFVRDVLGLDRAV